VPDDRLPQAQPNEGYFAASGTNIAVLGTDDVWIGTGAAARARVLRSSDRGRTWDIAETPMLSGAASGIYSIAFRDHLHGVIVGGTYNKESEAVDNCAITRDGGRTWTLTTEHGLSGFRSVVAYLPGQPGPSLIAVGPSGSDVSTDDGRTWTPVPGPGFHTFSLAHDSLVGWAAGSQGRIAKLEGLTARAVFYVPRTSNRKRLSSSSGRALPFLY
jgi:photosystem II stability/assembly factor-like uncharacterized protein